MSDQVQLWAKPMDGEPPEWYERFCRYRDLGSSRTVQLVWEKEWQAANTGKKGQKKPKMPPGSWQRQIRKWMWADRVAAMEEYRGAQSLITSENFIKQEKDRQHLILGELQNLQLSVLTAKTPQEQKTVALKAGFIGKFSGLFELGDTLFRSIHGVPKSDGKEGGNGDVIHHLVTYLPAHMVQSRLERAIEAKVEKVG
jgi:hypothetical protein